MLQRAHEVSAIELKKLPPTAVRFIRALASAGESEGIAYSASCLIPCSARVVSKYEPASLRDPKEVRFTPKSFPRHLDFVGPNWFG